jgi:parvulin-like peptidyl-prolyl isomerase
MSKKNADREKEQKKDAEEEDEEEDLEEEDEEEEDEEEEEEEPAAAKPVESRRPKARARRDDDHDDHGHGHRDEASEEDDPTWWTPHAVMSGLVLIGVLGFFGVFNKVLGGLAAKPIGGQDKPVAAETAGAAAAAKPPEQREEYGAKHLLVQFKGSMRAAPTITRTEDEAKARATEAMKKARGGANFTDVVKEYSDEPGAAQRGGDLGKFRKGQMVPEFQTAVEKMKVGEISDLVKTPFGYHVIQRTQ